MRCYRVWVGVLGRGLGWMRRCFGLSRGMVGGRGCGMRV